LLIENQVLVARVFNQQSEISNLKYFLVPRLLCRGQSPAAGAAVAGKSARPTQTLYTSLRRKS
jgi:hypothetical protein